MVEISERLLRLGAQGGWIGVDLDGTLAHYDEWVGWNVFGAPIQPMVERVRAWKTAGIKVKIMTARVGVFDRKTLYFKNKKCRVTGEFFSQDDMTCAIQAWCMKHVWRDGFLPVTCVKDVDMIELWDDRAVQVVANTGRTLAEEHAAEMVALRGKP